MTVQAIGAMNNRFIVHSSDTKPTDANNGATCFEWNTGYMFIYNGYAWIPKSTVPDQTDDGSPIVLCSNIVAAKANLTGNFYSVYRGPSVTAATKKVQLTIAGATAGAGKVADITVMWRPLVAGGYMLNA